MNALICSGFWCANGDSSKLDFRRTWLHNVGDRDVVIADCSEYEFVQWPANVEVIRVGQLGHVGDFLTKEHPKLGGWSMSWIIPMLVAYTQGRDGIYFEQDCLAFGDWEKQIYADMDSKGLLMAFGNVESHIAESEQSLVVIKHEFIPTAVSAYMAIDSGDGVTLPEAKYRMMEQANPKIGRFSLRGGRNRPIPYEDSAFYIQHITPEELTELKQRSLI